MERETVCEVKLASRVLHASAEEVANRMIP
jgi:hypothetical protein